MIYLAIILIVLLILLYFFPVIAIRLGPGDKLYLNSNFHILLSFWNFKPISVTAPDIDINKLILKNQLPNGNLYLVYIKF
jgi:hypothetical protein